MTMGPTAVVDEPAHSAAAPVLGECVPDDLALLRARDGDMGAFAELVRTNQRSVFSLALRLLGVREESQELAQDVFLQLHRNLSRIESGRHLHYWLRRTVTHRAIDRLRMRAREPFDNVESVPETEGSFAHADPLLEKRLRDSVTELPPMARAVVLLRYQEDFDPAEIAKMLDMSINTVKSHLKRSLALLRFRCRELKDGETP
jgi:RNA polymerase sigma-70 factor (ECF subfamily)